MSHKIALISDITGQDGAYFTELLLDKGYEIHGIIRRSSSFNTFRIDHIYNNPDLLNKIFFLHYGDLTDSSYLNRLVKKNNPDEIYNLGVQSHVQVSFEFPEYTAEVDQIINFPKKLYLKLGWENTTTFMNLVKNSTNHYLIS